VDALLRNLSRVPVENGLQATIRNHGGGYGNYSFIFLSFHVMIACYVLLLFAMI
jgi:hypothetical protein